jgi:hypothetical protein
MRLSGPHARPTTSQKKSGSAGIEPGTSGSVARNSDHSTTEAVLVIIIIIIIIIIHKKSKLSLISEKSEINKFKMVMPLCGEKG